MSLNVTCEELAQILKVGHGAPIKEADAWMPLAKHVLGLIALAEKPLLEEIQALKDKLELARTLSQTDSRPCPLCRYENGVLRELCEKDQELEHFHVQLQRITLSYNELKTAERRRAIHAAKECLEQNYGLASKKRLVALVTGVIQGPCDCGCDAITDAGNCHSCGKKRLSESCPCGVAH
jgi:hypothetical protein